jgi:hypothetical protein
MKVSLRDSKGNLIPGMETEFIITVKDIEKESVCATASV